MAALLYPKSLILLPLSGDAREISARAAARMVKIGIGREIIKAGRIIAIREQIRQNMQGSPTTGRTIPGGSTQHYQQQLSTGRVYALKGCQ